MRSFEFLNKLRGKRKPEEIEMAVIRVMNADAGAQGDPLIESATSPGTGQASPSTVPTGPTASQRIYSVLRFAQDLPGKITTALGGKFGLAQQFVQGGIQGIATFLGEHGLARQFVKAGVRGVTMVLVGAVGYALQFIQAGVRGVTTGLQFAEAQGYKLAQWVRTHWRLVILGFLGLVFPIALILGFFHTISWTLALTIVCCAIILILCTCSC